MVGGVEEADGTILPQGGGEDAPARSLQELLARLPKGRGASAPAGQAVQPPLRPNREFRGATIDEPAPPLTDNPGGVRERPMAAAAVAQDEPRVGGLPLPRRVTGISTGRKLWFALSFLAPVILGAIYLFLIAPDQYVTEFRYSVRVPVGQAGTLASGQSPTSPLFGGNPTPGTDLLDNFMVADYVRSSQAAADLDATLNLKSMYNKPGDPFARVGGNASRERLARFWKSMIYSDYDVTTGLAVVRVRAYSAQDSYAIATTLLSLSNALVNSIGNQSQLDTVHFAQRQLARADQSVSDLRRQISLLSHHGGLDNPSIGVLPAENTLATDTRTNVSQIQSEIEVLNAQLHNPDAPQIVMLRQELAANKRALDAAVRAGEGDSTNHYADLTAQLQNALSVQSTAQAALALAQGGADAQRLYITTYVKPLMADASTWPNRWLDLLLVVLGSAIVWVIGMLVRNSVMEHGN